MRKTMRIFQVLSILSALLMVACGDASRSGGGGGTGDGSGAGDGSGGGKAKWTIGMSQCNLGEPWRVQMNADVKNAADKVSDIKVIFKDEIPVFSPGMRRQRENQCPCEAESSRHRIHDPHLTSNHGPSTPVSGGVGVESGGASVIGPI